MSKLDGNGTCPKCELDYSAQLGFRACSCMVVHKPKKIEDMDETEAIAAALKYKLLNKVMYDAFKDCLSYIDIDNLTMQAKEKEWKQALKQVGEN